MYNITVVKTNPSNYILICALILNKKLLFVSNMSANQRINLQIHD